MLFWSLVGMTVHGQASDKPVTQHFVCHKGFTVDECRLRMAVLKKVLDRYHADRLGEWNWVLVRTTDWRAILSVRGFDNGSPAFTYLPGNETFFDEALTLRESIRGMELMEVWQMSIEDLLDKAVRHELAHATCREKDEFRAIFLEERLRSGASVTCRFGKIKSGKTSPSTPQFRNDFQAQQP
jgi:hypothetical protein